MRSESDRQASGQVGHPPIKSLVPRISHPIVAARVKQFTLVGRGSSDGYTEEVGRRMAAWRRHPRTAIADVAPVSLIVIELP
jgi:hypothetical protein